MSGPVGFSVRASFPEFNATKYLKDLKEHLQNALIMAARKFLLAAVPRIPIFTGFARGAFGNLEDLVGRFQAGGTKGASIGKKLKGYSKAQNFAKRKYYYYPTKGSRVIRNTVTGRQFATKPENIFSAGRAKIAKGQTALFFRFSVNIKYVNYLDRAKWAAFKSGQAAFNTELRAQLDQLPQVGKYIIKRAIK